MRSVQEILLQGAAQENDAREGALIPVAVAAGVGGVAVGAPADALVNMIRRRRNPKAQTARGMRLAGAGVMGLAGAIGVANMPNQAGAMLAKLEAGGSLTNKELDYIEQLAKQQYGRV